MYLEEVEEVLDYLRGHPTAAEILTAVHEIEVRTVSNFKPVVEKDFKNDIFKLPSSFGMDVEKPPEDFLASIEFAQSLQEKMKIN